MLNNITLAGRLTKDPEVKEKGGKKYAKYSIAVKRDFGDETDFFNVVAFDKAGEFAATYLKKGMLISLTGRVQATNYEDKDKIKRTSFDIIVNSQYFMQPKSNNSPNNQDDDMPF